MMATRTKDNDFSRIILTEDEIREKNAIEEKLRQKRIADPKERMKQRIEMETEAELAPKKRKKKKASYEEECEDLPPIDYTRINKNPHNYVDNKQLKEENQKASNKKAPPPLNFNDLLKLAEKKQKEEPKPTLIDEIESVKSIRPVKRKVDDYEEQLKKLRAFKEKKRATDASTISSRQEINERPQYKTQTNKVNKIKSSYETQEQPKIKTQTKNKSISDNMRNSAKQVREENVPIKYKPQSTNKYSQESLNNYERSLKQQKSKYRDEYSPPPFSKEKFESKKNQRVEEYSPTEPYINKSMKNKKLINKVRPSDDENDDYVKYRPTAKKEIAERSHISESPEKSMNEFKSKKLPISATMPKYKPTNNVKNIDNEIVSKSSNSAYSSNKIRPATDLQPKLKPSTATSSKYPTKESLTSKKSTEIMAQRMMGSMANRLPGHPSNRREQPKETNKKLNEYSKAEIRAAAERIMERPRPKLPPIGLHYRRGMYGDNYEDYADSDKEEEEEEDEEMRDFIDDGDYDLQDDDYSKYIREIFGYDKRKYVDDDDDDIMETNFDEQEREELRSARIGFIEDLEDMRKEAEEKRRKAMLKRKRPRIVDDEDEDEDD
ncbi:Protein SPT2-like protein [Dinothrombium tinctorium]|nr:Protein SPT2-like protein [Dinothrombium tinctorium]